MICIAKTDPKPDCLFAFTGHPFDKEVGLQSNGLRHYDPTVRPVKGSEVVFQSRIRLPTPLLVPVDNYQYNGVLGQMSQVTQSGVSGGDVVAEKSVTFTYDNLGEFSTITRYADLGETEQVAESIYGYDLNGNLTSLVYYNSSNGGVALPSYSLTYDALGNMTSSDEVLGSSINDSVNYTSDSTGQLLSATPTSGPPSDTYPDTESYLYDPNGNRETVTTNGNQVTCITGGGNELLFDGTYTYAYDADGKQTARWIAATNTNPPETQPGPDDTDITIYTWDNRNRLTSVTSYATYGAAAEQTVTYAYDVFNRWIGETVTAGGTTTQTRYVYDGNQIVMQFQGTGSGPLAANNLSDRYLWGPAVDQLLADEQLTPVTGGGYDLGSAGTVVWTLTDNENTVRDLAIYSNGTTTVFNHREFSAYGKLLSQTNPQTRQAAAVDCVFAYTGRALDQATGLQNNDNRWYDAITGRWLSQDPSEFLGGDANLYRYVNNAPIDATDPYGLQIGPGYGTLPIPFYPPRPNPVPSAPSGNWSPGTFFGRNQDLYNQTIFGCGGLAAWRARLKVNANAGVYNPMDFARFPSYSTLPAAQAALKKLPNGGIIVAIQSSVPNWQTQPGSGNFVSFLGTSNSPYCEDVNTGWRHPNAKIYHWPLKLDPAGNPIFHWNFKYVVYVVVSF